MIKSITYSKDGSGYLSMRYKKPEKPKKQDFTYNRKCTTYDQALENYKAELEFYKKIKDKYYRSMKKYKEGEIQNTYLFDEPDKSLDIPTIISLYTKVIPYFFSKYKQQIIMVSHSPIILSKKVEETGEYTNECRKLLGEIF